MADVLPVSARESYPIGKAIGITSSETGPTTLHADVQSDRATFGF